MTSSGENYPVNQPEGLRKPAIERIRCRPAPPPRPRPHHGDDVALFKVTVHVKFSTLLKRTTHDDPLVRKDAFLGIQDYISVGEYPWDSVKTETAMFKKICYGITDTDDGVREAAYNLLDMVKSCRKFEDYVASLLVPTVVEALAHTELGVNVTGKNVYHLLVRRMPSCIHLFLRKAIQTLEDTLKTDVNELQRSYLPFLRVFQTVNVCLSSMPSSECYEILFDKRSLGVLKRVLSAFPMFSEHLDIDIEVMKIFLRLPKLSDSDKFLAFINDKLHKITEGESNLEEHLAFFPPYVPMLVTGLGSHSQATLIQAFTMAFRRSHPESAFKSACIAAIQLMVSGSFVQEVNSELFQLCRREWLEELSTLLDHGKRCTSYRYWKWSKDLPLVMSILRGSGDSE